MSEVMTLLDQHDFAIAIGVAISKLHNADVKCLNERGAELEAINNLYLIYLDYCIEEGVEPYTLSWFQHWDFDNSRRVKRIQEMQKKGEL